mgnify:CR=1 FL=1
MNNKKNTLQIVVGSLLVLLLIGVTVLLISEKRTNNELVQEFNLEKEDLENQYTDFAKQYDELKLTVSNDSLSVLLEQEQLKTQRLLEELRTVKSTNATEIRRLKKELADVERHRELLRSQRNQSGMKVAALVGYTSAGKSSIENALTNAGILEDAMLFSTLDTTTRALQLDGTQEILLTDTVGFIRKLPHHLIEAFKSTLEEAKYADIIIHVVDVSNPRMDEQMYVVYDTLRQMGAEGKPVITLFNKQDRLEKEESHKDFQADYSIATSAKTGQGLDKLKAALLEIIRRDQIYVERLYPFADAGKIQMIRSKGQLLSEEYLPEGIQIKAYVPQDVYGKL